MREARARVRVPRSPRGGAAADLLWRCHAVAGDPFTDISTVPAEPTSDAAPSSLAPSVHSAYAVTNAGASAEPTPTASGPSASVASTRPALPSLSEALRGDGGVMAKITAREEYRTAEGR